MKPAIIYAFAALFLPAQAGETQKQRIVREGIAIEYSMENLAAGRKAGQFQEEDQVVFRFRISDTTTGAPLSGVYPAAWMDLHHQNEPVTPENCQSKVEAFIGGSLFAPPELDLNVYFVLALNDDASISVVDPLFGFGTTKLLDMIFLKSPGEDWTLTPDQKTLYVSMPDSNQLAVAETYSWEVVANLDVWPRPTRVALQPDAAFLWVAGDAPRDESGLSGVTVLNTRDSSVAKHIATGRGHHEIAFGGDNLYAYLTNQQDGTLTVIDIRKLEKVRDIEVGKQPVSLAFSSLSRAVYVVSRQEGTVLAVDGRSHEVVARMEAKPGLGQIKFAPGGRLGLVVNPETDELHIIDVALNRIVQTGDMEKGPDQLAFSDHLAYVRHRHSEIVLMVPLDQIGLEGRPVPVADFTGGQRPYGQAARPSLADAIVQAPGATAVLVANPSDKTIYFYKEGMAAPMGSFHNYEREPRAVLVVDRSLQERAPGVYETTAQLRRPGPYDVAFFLDSPRTIHCFRTRVEANPKLAKERAKKRPLDIEPLIESRQVKVGRKVSLKFRLTDPATRKPRKGLKDVNVLTFRGPGQQQKRQWAKEVGDGLYQVDFVPPQAGVYYVFIECRSLGLRYDRSSPLILRARE